MIFEQLEKGAPRRRVGLRPEGKAPLRAGTQLLSGAGEPAGLITSGGFAPSLGALAAMGYVHTQCLEEGAPLKACCRGRDIAVHLAPLNAVPLRYQRRS